MAKTAKTATQASASAAHIAVASPAPARPTRNARATRNGGSVWLRNTLLFFLLFCIMGIVPLALISETLVGWRLPLGGLPLLAPGSGASSTIYDTPLAHPATMEVKTAARILSQPATGAPLAILQPGFHVSGTQYAHSGATRWAHITWGGPTRTSGGAGWTLASDLQAPAGGATSSIGDLGALSPDFNQRLATYSNHLVVVVYFPATHALYLTSNAQQSIPIGGGFRAILLADLYAQAEKSGAQPVPAPLAQGVAIGDPVAAGVAYQQLGDGVGVSNFLLDVHISGITPATGDWQGAAAIPQALLMFYAHLFEHDNGALVSSADQTAIQQLLANASASASPNIIRPDALGSGGALVIDNGKESGAQGTQGAWASASGLLTPANGPQAVVVVFGRNESSASAAQNVLRAFFGQLAIVLAG